MLPERTFRETATSYIGNHSPTWRNLKHKAGLKPRIYAYPRIASQPLIGVTRRHIPEILTPIWATKRETARRVRERIEMVFAFALAQG